MKEMCKLSRDEVGKHNTAHNKRHGLEQECDGQCAVDECVCDHVAMHDHDEDCGV